MCVSSSVKMTDAFHNILECLQLQKKINQPGLFKKANVGINRGISSLLFCHVSTPHFKSVWVSMWVAPTLDSAFSCTLDS